MRAKNTAHDSESLVYSSPNSEGKAHRDWDKPGLPALYLVNGIWVFRHIKDDSCGSSLHCPLCLQ